MAKGCKHAKSVSQPLMFHLLETLFWIPCPNLIGFFWCYHFFFWIFLFILDINPVSDVCLFNWMMVPFAAKKKKRFLLPWGTIFQLLVLMPMLPGCLLFLCYKFKCIISSSIVWSRVCEVFDTSGTLHRVRVKDLVSFFYTQLLRFISTTCWKCYFFSSGYFLAFLKRRQRVKQYGVRCGSLVVFYCSMFLFLCQVLCYFSYYTVV